jgi:hypothetical protein
MPNPRCDGGTRRQGPRLVARLAISAEEHAAPIDAAFVDDDTFVAARLRVLRDLRVRVQVRVGTPLADAFAADALRIPATAVEPQPRRATRSSGAPIMTATGS